MYERVTIEDFANVKEKYIAEKIDSFDEKRKFEGIKRIMDIIISSVAIVVLITPMILIAILIRIESEGNPIFSQKRLGKNEKEFILYKFRSMYIDAEKSGIQWARNEDDRVTRIGKLLRATRIDELPQLFNILKGEMSFVGPRPERPEFYNIFDTYIYGFRQRMLVKPGLTGLAQIVGGYSLLPEEKIVFDIEYIKHRCLAMDIKLILKTVGVVFRGDKKRDDLANVKCCSIVKDIYE